MRYKDILLCLLSGILLSLSFSFSQCWILAWVGFIPLFIALENKSVKKAFLLSYLTGLVFWSGTIYWLIHVTLFGQILLILYLALYFGIFGFLLSFVFSRKPLALLFFAPSLWVVLEYLRSHLLTGFPWALLGYSQYANLPIIQIADIAGVWLVSFLVMMVNMEIYLIRKSVITSHAVAKQSPKSGIASSLPFASLRVAPGNDKGICGSLAMTAIVLLLVLSYGYYKLYQAPCLAGRQASSKLQAPLRISVIQGNIPQELKWDARAREFILERYFELTAEAKKDNPDLIIWPEASLPSVLEEEPVYYQRLLSYTKTIQTSLLFGAVTDRNGSYYNSALLLSKEGELEARYDKLHLVPFGEFIPFRKTLSFLETIAPIGDIVPGKDYTLFNLRHHFGVLICFEDIFPELGRRFVRKGADFLVNITNDAWFGRTFEAYQHLAASVFRAIENRVNVVRSANTGVSAFINPEGRILSLVNDGTGKVIFIPGYLTQDIFVHRQPTFYGYYGDFFIILCLICVLFIGAGYKKSFPRKWESN